MEYHPLTNTITELLKKNGTWFETFEHKPVRTSEEAADVRTGYTLKQGAKALILRIKSNGLKKFSMIVLPGDAKFDKEKIKKVTEAKDIRFAFPEEVKELTSGVEPGGVPPFGNLFEMDVFADESLFENEKIVFNAGDKRFSVAMKSKDYKEIVKPRIVTII